MTTTTAPEAPEQAEAVLIPHPSLAHALAAFQAECPPIRKGNRATVPTKSGGQYTYDYADLSDVIEVVAPVLARHGLSFNGRPTATKHGFGLKYQLRHISGQADKGFYPLPDPGRMAAQDMGAWLTYVRRYVLCTIVGVAPGGDDNDAAVADPWKPRGQRQQPREQRQPRQQKAKPQDTAKEAPKADPEWLKRAEAAVTKEDADVVWAELRTAVQAGQATVATTDAVAALWRSRKAAEAEAAAAAPVEAPAAAEGVQA